LVLARGINSLQKKGELKLILKDVVNFSDLPDWIYLPVKEADSKIVH
jgi:ABC-type polysaccharide/polyol phosphate transport system ATPase subunit